MSIQQHSAAARGIKESVRIVLKRPRWGSATKGFLMARANTLQESCFKNRDVLSSSCIWRTQENATRSTSQLWKDWHLSKGGSPDDLNEVYLAINLVHMYSTLYILWFELDTQRCGTLAWARWDGLYCSQVCSCFLQQVNIKTCLESHIFASEREAVWWEMVA